MTDQKIAVHVTNKKQWNKVKKYYNLEILDFVACKNVYPKNEELAIDSDSQWSSLEYYKYYCPEYEIMEFNEWQTQAIGGTNMAFKSLNNVIKEWSNNTLELGSTVMYPHSKFVDFNFDGIEPIDVENIKEDFKDKPNIHFDIMKAEYYREVPVKIVGATLLFKNKPRFDIEGIGWGTNVDVDVLLKGIEFEDYELRQNEIFNQFMNRFNELKKVSE